MAITWNNIVTPWKDGNGMINQRKAAYVQAQLMLLCQSMITRTPIVIRCWDGHVYSDVVNGVRVEDGSGHNYFVALCFNKEEVFVSLDVAGVVVMA